MLTAAKVGCRSHGVDVIENRVEVAVQFMRMLIDKGKVPHHYAHLVSFAHLNAAAERGPLLVDGVHASHILINNLVFSESNNRQLAQRLNQTFFKMLAWCCNADKSKELGLMDVRMFKK